MSNLPPSAPAPGAGEPTDTATPLPVAPSRGRRAVVVGAVAVGVLAVLGGGAAAAVFLLGGHGPQPEEVLPASTLAEVSVDLDPSASQKLAAYQTLRKFPALKKQLDLGTGDDLRRTIFEKAIEDSDCRGLRFDKDVAPWLGDRAALAAVDLSGKLPAPALAVQVSNQARARAGVDKLVACSHPGSDFGYAFADGYVVISDSTAHARSIVAAGQQAPLSADAGYTDWEGQVGDRGVVNFYVAKKAADWLTQHADAFAGGGAAASPADAVTKQVKAFQGLSGTVRFTDGGIEVAAVGGGVPDLTGSGNVSAAVAALPADTAAVLGFATPPDYARQLVASMGQLSGEDSSQLVAQVETLTGLHLPDDLQTLLGKAVTVSLGGNPPDLRAVSSPADLPVGATITGDTAGIQGVIHKVTERQGISLAQLGIAEEVRAGRVALAPSQEYADQLLGGGGLGRSAAFRGVVPEADKASSVMFVDFDSPWLGALVRLARDQGAPAGEAARVQANLQPLEAFGASAWQDGATSHVLVKLTTN